MATHFGRSSLVHLLLLFFQLLDSQLFNKIFFEFELLHELLVGVIGLPDLAILVLDQLDHLPLIVHKFVHLLDPVVILAAENLAISSRKRPH